MERAALRRAAADSFERRQAKLPVTREAKRYQRMSGMGALAAGIAPPRDLEGAPLFLSGGRDGIQGLHVAPSVVGATDVVVNGLNELGTQSETSIAANADGSILVAGYNDAQGFPTSTTVKAYSLSGVARSADGGKTWAPVVPAGGTLGVLPFGTGQVFGDPDVKFDAKNNRFVYSSIFVRASDGAQGMSIALSDASGQNWSDPIEIAPTFSATDSADKEFMDVNQTTGRILVTWTNFPNSGNSTIKSTFSDDGGATWSAAVVVSTDAASQANGVQASMPRFFTKTGTADAYVVWRVFPGTQGENRNVACARSVDDGATWSAPVLLDSADSGQEDQLPGVDRVNTSPSMAIDQTSGRVYVVYQRNDATGTGDIALRSFVGNCATGVPTLLDSNPGADRSQWFPWVSVDQSTHDVHVTFNDEDADTSGDLNSAMLTSSSNAGTTWTPPTTTLDRPFHAGYGNDTGQPNMGDYNQNVSFGGATYSVTGATGTAPTFSDGQPARTLSTPDVYMDKRLDSQKVVPLRLTGTTVAEVGCVSGANGRIDPGETLDLTATLKNYVANAVAGAAPVTGVVGTLSTSTPGVTVTSGTSTYAALATLASVANTTPFTFAVSATFVPGTYIDFTLALDAGTQGAVQLPIRLPTGTPGAGTNVIDETFEGATAPALPAGWSSVDTDPDAGTGADPWTTSTTWMPGKAAFHAEGQTGTSVFVRLFSPVVTIPSTTDGFVTLDFDVKYDLEDEPALTVQAYDGLTLRITDQTSGQLRSVLAEAFAEYIHTGTQNHFPKHNVRNNDATYFQDMSVWSGDSGGVVHVAMKFPGAGLMSRPVQLRFEYTEDTNGDCTTAGHTGPCGVGIDNVVLAQVPVTNGACITSSVDGGTDAGSDAGDAGIVTIGGDSGTDSGSAGDAGDAGEGDSGLEDAGADSGSVHDAGTKPDAGNAGADSGSGNDAGPVGSDDAGPAPGIDSGTGDDSGTPLADDGGNDGGTGGPGSSGGCGCVTAGASPTNSSGMGGVAGVLASVALLARRRRNKK